MNGVRIYIGNDINNKNIVLNGEAIDLFNDENIQITLKQTDVRDIAQNYADFTQSFTVPASPKNNRIFKYWYDTNYDNQFSSVSGVPCRIDIDGVFFKKGTVTIKEFQTNENGVVKNYKIQFTANLKSLKDKFGDKKIGELDFTGIIPSNEITITDASVKSIIQNYAGNGYLEYPMISTTRLIDNFDTIKYINSSTANGIRKEELRPALKLKHIFQAIAKFYEIRFIGDFYNTNSPLDKIYLWLNKNENPFSNTGKILDLSGTFTSGDFPYPPSSSVVLNASNDVFTVTKTGGVYTIGTRAILNTTNTVTQYKIFLQRVVLNTGGAVNEVATNNQDNGGFVASSDWVTGTSAIVYNQNVQTTPNGTKFSYRIIVETRGGIVFSSIAVRVSKLSYSFGFVTETANLNSTTVNNLPAVFGIPINLPDMTIQDFISSIIKMFNLVVIPITDPLVHNQLGSSEVFQLEYYTKFYGQVQEIDITKYTKRNYSGSKIQTYKKFEFKHADSSYGMNKIFKESQSPNREYGSVKSEFNLGDNGELKIESKFNLAIFKELPNFGLTSSYNLENTWIFGDCLNEDFTKGVFNKPTIFYYNRKSQVPAGKKIAYTRADNVSEELFTYSIFSNVDDLDANTYNTTLAFSAESFFNSNVREKSLYFNYYKSLLNGIYSPYSREFQFEAILPKSIFTKLSLGNRLIIGNKRYGINDLTINLLNGATKLKLNNVIEESDIQEVYIDTQPPIIPTTFTYSVNGTASINLSWSGATDDFGILGYELSYKPTSSAIWSTLPFISTSNSFGDLVYSPYPTSDTDIRIRVRDTSNNWSINYNSITVIV